MHRSSGILLHPTSLPGPQPVGDLGPAAWRWIEWLEEADITWWQILPLNPPGFSASPYQALSAFAGNPLLISVELLASDGLIDGFAPADPPGGVVDFAGAEQWKAPLLIEAAANLPRDEGFARFRSSNAFWLDDYALFSAIKRDNRGRSFLEWPSALRGRSPDALRRARSRYSADAECEAAIQYIFFDQWSRLRRRAAAHGVRILGDLPIFVAADSADMWTHPELFDLDNNGHPRVVAGVPSDFFAATGQLWGNPLYAWDRHAAEGFAWWIARLNSLGALVDAARIDHFRALADYWEIPAGSPTAEKGSWVPGPGKPFFDAVQQAVRDLPLVAEDLGELHAVVTELRRAVGLPGMKIGQASFEAPMDPPSEWPEDTIGYTGTHDNNTTVGWWDSASADERGRATAMADIGPNDPAHDLITAVWKSASVLAVAPIQDVLSLGSEHRMNLPGTVGPDNWTWRLERLPEESVAAWLQRLNESTGRRSTTGHPDDHQEPTR